MSGWFLNELGQRWYVIAACLALLVVFTRQLVRNARAWRCPACRATRHDWIGSGNQGGVDFRYYNCACGAKLVKEDHGVMQLREHWIPGHSPVRPAKAKVVERT